MFEAKQHRAVEKKESSTETDEGLGSSGRHFGSGSLGSGSGGSVYLSDSQDWVVSPGCSPDEGPAPHHQGPAPHHQGPAPHHQGPAHTSPAPHAISPLLAEEAFRYMTYLSLDPDSYSDSSGLNKVGAEQMKTYNDLEVVTHLLAERDRDLELAARIGQSLLQRNHLLQERNETIEDQLTQALDQMNQLQHELSKKDELLRMVATEESDSASSTPLQQTPPPGAVYTATAALSQLEHLQNKLQDLEDENTALRSEASQLKRDTINYEEKEQRLVHDCVKELRESNSQMVTLTEDLTTKNQELLRHQEEMAQLLSQIVDLQHRVKQLALEKEELRIHLQASKDAQRQLTAELNEVTERNAECLEMFHESQEEIKELRNRNSPFFGTRRHMCYGLYPMDSLAAEIEGTMRREMSFEEESTLEDQRVSQKRVFQTVRSLNTAVSSRPPSAGPPSAGPPPAGPPPAGPPPAGPPIPGSGSSLVMTSQHFCSPEEVKMGRPGSPGGGDLAKALHRLSLRRHNYLCERQFFQSEREKFRSAGGDGDTSGCSSPMGSVLSSFSNLSELSSSCSLFKTFLPEKLQIVKPMEGSLTLHHWQQLAKPHLASILDPHPGIVTKGFRPLSHDVSHRLSDTEEDEDQDRTVVEKGATEQGKDQEEQEEEQEESGITFRVRSDRRDRKQPVRPLPVPPVSLNVSTPITNAHTENQSAPSIPVTSSQSNHTTLTTSASSGLNPGRCQSSTFSTFTFTTCRILHPTDITHMTHSSQSSLMSTTRAPSSMRAPVTPVTPCRLSLGETFPSRRPVAPPSGSLAKLVLERGICAQVSSEGPPPSPRPKHRPPLLLCPITPPSSPSASPSPLPSERPADNFLASRPAESILQDVYGLNLGRAPHPNLPSPSQDAPGGAPKPQGPIVDRLRKLGFQKVLQSESRLDSTFVSAGGGSLLDGLRRNQSLPALIGAKASSSTHLQHPTSLAIAAPPWGSLKDKRQPHVTPPVPTTKS